MNMALAATPSRLPTSLCKRSINNLFSTNLRLVTGFPCGIVVVIKRQECQPERQPRYFMPRVRLRACRLFVGAALLILSSHANAEEIVPSDSLSITTFNVKYFGINGNPSSTTPESRVDTLKDHLARNHLTTDVMVFEEIVDVDMLKTQVLGRGYNCRSYNNSAPQHQHVAICYKSEFTLENASDDDDDVLADVMMGEERYRPAVHGILKNRRGQALLHIVGVHLKAFPEFSNIRLQQADIIATYLDQRADSDVPVAILGDFNTYGNDAENLNNRFVDAGEGLKKVAVNAAFTWRGTGSRTGQKFDHVWISNHLTASNVRVAGPCNSNDRAAIKAYNSKVSDHCPVTMTLSRATSRE